MVITATNIAASIEATARDICIAMRTFQMAPKGMRLRADLLVSVDQLHERMAHQLTILARKQREEK